MRLNTLKRSAAWRLGAGCAVAATLVASLPAAAEAGAARASMPPAHQTASAASPAVPSAAQMPSGAALAAVEKLRTAVSASPDQYVGLSTQSGDAVTIHVVSGDPYQDTKVAGAARAVTAAGIRVTVAKAAHSLSQLNRIDAAIPQSAPFAALGGGLVRWGPDPASDSVLVGVTRVTPRLLADVRSRYGDTVRVEQASAATAVSGRFTDTPWFYGGDRITVGNGYCTSGFTMTNLYGTHYAITAGHCWATGTEVTTNGQEFGVVDFRRWGSDNYDNELIGGVGYSGRMWIGGVNTSTSIGVSGAANSCTGCQVYFNGSVTGQSLATLVGSPFCGTIYDGGTNSYYTACGLQDAVGSNPICNPGDSGGPVFAYDGAGRVTAVGIITASVNSKNCWYTQLPPILSSWEATITTG
jgi:hypothetical protein